MKENAKLYSNKCILNSLKCIKIAAVGAPLQTTLGGAYTDPDTHDVCIYVFGNGKNEFEICEFIGRVGGLPGCVSDLTGNNLADFVCFAFIKKILLFSNNRSVEK